MTVVNNGLMEFVITAIYITQWQHSTKSVWHKVATDYQKVERSK